MEPNNEVNAKLIAKIQKIMAMADPKNGASEGEVANATLLMNKLLQDNGLSLAQVQASGEKADTAREKSLTERRAHYKWQKELMSMLAAVNFCWHTVDKVRHRDPSQKKGPDGEHPWRTSSLHILVGRPINITVTIQMYDYLSRAITREAVKRDYEHGTKDNNQFFEGAVSKLAERLRDQKEKREQDDREKRRAEQARQSKAGKGTGTDLVILEEVYSTEEDYNADFRDGLKPGTTAERRKKQQVTKEALDRKRAELEALGIDWVVAWFMAHGFPKEEAEKRAKEYYAREKREREKGFREFLKKGSAFHDGREAAEKIGLNAQVGSDKNRIK
jgi:hypothetical protein